LWEVELNEIVKLTLQDTVPFKKAWEIGGYYSRYFLSGVRTSEDMPKNISNFTIQLSRSINDQYKIWGDLSISKGFLFRKKKDETVIENISANSTSGGDILSWSVSVSRHFIPNTSGISPYIAAGISNTRAMLMFAPTGGSDFHGGMKFYSYGSLMLTSGIEIKVVERLRVNTRLSYHLSLNSFNTINSLNLSLGLNFKLQRKPTSFIQYLRLK
jgi:hypothetical protein